MNANTPAEFIARLLAQRWLPKSDAEVRRLLIDESFRQDIEHRLAATGLRLLDNPFAGHVAAGLAADSENAVFGRGDAWLSSNAGLNRDGVALLILLWALIILPKRERQLSRDATTDEGQSDLFGNAQAAPLRDDAARGVPENVLLEDYGRLLGGKARLQFLLPVLSRLGFIERRNKVLHEGPLLDLAFDYAELAPRILDGALADVLVAVNGKKEAKTASTASGDA
ncbi:MAG: hypothetical protein J0M01_12285 [Dechloromonas sp.]|jgi:hypothetical protein|nr:hypothetical protein [Dechloromonas sp.]